MKIMIIKKFFLKNNSIMYKFFYILIASIIILSSYSIVLLSLTKPGSARDLEKISSVTGYSATIWTTDIYGNLKTYYSYGEIVYIHGNGFLENHNVDVDVARPDNSIESGFIITDSFKYFLYEYDLKNISGTYSIMASDGINTATTTFSAAVAGIDFRQYATLTDTWIGSILQQSNSQYYEGMSVPQRIAFVDIDSTTDNVHNLTLSHQATKGGIHAYDWLTAWNQGNVPPLTYIPWGDNIGPQVTTTICGNLHNQSGANEIFVDVPDDPFISKDGSTQTRINAYESLYGNRQIRICGNQPTVINQSYQHHLLVFLMMLQMVEILVIHILIMN
jgi:hypothetical protein